ncbi:hypothetical protein N9V88_01010 [bacterium]|nr:hypothetical protein [bacterium]
MDCVVVLVGYFLECNQPEHRKFEKLELNSGGIGPTHAESGLIERETADWEARRCGTIQASAVRAAALRAMINA